MKNEVHPTRDAEIGSLAIQATDGAARASRFVTAHGEVEMPAFFPVATRAAVKMATMADTRDAGAQGLLMNAFHLHLKPGEDEVAALGGVHGFAGWDRPVVTDSGGFQVFSLSKLRKITDDGVEFASPIDGSRHRFTPEGVIDIQRKLGSDVMIALDECVRYPAPREEVERSVRRTIDWCRRSAARWRETSLRLEHPRTAGAASVGCRAEAAPAAKAGPALQASAWQAGGASGDAGREQLLFGVVQGGTVRELRLECAAALAESGLPGYAVGSVSVGEGPALMREVLSYTLEALPADRPRYVMGVGAPEDLVDGVAMGADLFDCVMPTRNARGACAFTRDGKVRLRNAAHAGSEEPVEPGCDCPCCTSVSRGYLRHLYIVGETAAAMLVTQHNLRFYARLMREIREAIREGEFGRFREEFLGRYMPRR